MWMAIKRKEEGEVWMQLNERRRGRGRCNKKEGRRENERK